MSLNILTFEEFEYAMKGIAEERGFQEGIYNAFKNIGGSCYRDTPAIYTAIMLLDKIFLDDDDTPLIDYWVYELDCGKLWKPGCVKDDAGNDIVLMTVSDLYDALVKQYVDKKEG